MKTVFEIVFAFIVIAGTGYAMFKFITSRNKKIRPEHLATHLAAEPSKTKARKNHSVKWSKFHYHRICGYWFWNTSVTNAILKLRGLVERKGCKLHVELHKNLTFIYLNERNRLRKLKLYDSVR